MPPNGWIVVLFVVFLCCFVHPCSGQNVTAQPVVTAPAATTTKLPLIYGTTAPPRDRGLPPETPIPPPPGQGKANETEAPILDPEDAMESSITRSFAWKDIERMKQRVANKWWVLAIAFPTGIFITAGISYVLQHYRQSNQGQQATLFHDLLARSLASVAFVAGILALLTTAAEDPDSGGQFRTDSFFGRWPLLVSWSYHTMFIFMVVYLVSLVVLYLLLVRTVRRWAEWELMLPRDPTAIVDSGVDLQIILLSALRKMYYGQLRLLFPNADFLRVYNIRVTNYIRTKEVQMVHELASFRQWSDWLSLAILVTVNGLRIAAISHGELKATEDMGLKDALTFAFVIGVIPLLLFLIVYKVLIRSLWKFVYATNAVIDKISHRRERDKVLDFGIKEVDDSRLELDRDPTVVRIAVLAQFPSPIDFVPFRSIKTLHSLWRGIVILNALYIAILVTGLSEALINKVPGGPAFLFICVIPSFFIIRYLPWTTAVLVMCESLGRQLDIEAAARTFMDPVEERARALHFADLRGPSPQHDEGDDDQRAAEVQFRAAAAAKRALNPLALVAMPKVDAPPPLTTTSILCEKGVMDQNGKLIGEAVTTATVQSSWPAKAPEPEELPPPPKPSALDIRDRAALYQLNLTKVNERIVQLKEAEELLAQDLVLASGRRRKTQYKLENFVEAISRRPDIGPEWEQHINLARTQAHHLRRGAAVDYYERLKELERTRSVVTINDPSDSRFTFDDHVDSLIRRAEKNEAEKFVALNYVPSTAEVLEAVQPTAHEKRCQLPQRKITQVESAEAAAERRHMYQALPEAVRARQRHHRREERNAARGYGLLDPHELYQRLEASQDDVGGGGLRPPSAISVGSGLTSWQDDVDSHDQEVALKWPLPDPVPDPRMSRAPTLTPADIERMNDFSRWGEPDEDIFAVENPLKASQEVPGRNEQRKEEEALFDDAGSMYSGIGGASSIGGAPSGRASTVGTVGGKSVARYFNDPDPDL